jgi:hypothetical protein
LPVFPHYFRHYWLSFHIDYWYWHYHWYFITRQLSFSLAIIDAFQLITILHFRWFDIIVLRLAEHYFRHDIFFITPPDLITFRR